MAKIPEKNENIFDFIDLYYTLLPTKTIAYRENIPCRKVNH